MKRFIVSIGLMLSMTSVLAGITADDLGAFNKLSDIQKADVVARMAQHTNTNGSGSMPTTPEQMKEWVNFGAAIGKGMASIVAELGVSIDKFMDTTAGKIAMGLLIWEVAGRDIIGVLFGIVWFATMIPVWVYFFRRIGMGMKVEYLENEKGKPVKTITYNDIEASNDMQAIFFVMIIVIIAAGTLAIFAG